MFRQIWSSVSHGVHTCLLITVKQVKHWYAGQEERIGIAYELFQLPMKRNSVVRKEVSVMSGFSIFLQYHSLF